MSIRAIIIIGVLIILSITIAAFIVFAVQVDEAMPRIAQTAEAKTNATLAAEYKLTNPAP